MCFTEKKTITVPFLKLISCFLHHKLHLHWKLGGENTRSPKPSHKCTNHTRGISVASVSPTCGEFLSTLTQVYSIYWAFKIKNTLNKTSSCKVFVLFLQVTCKHGNYVQSLKGNSTKITSLFTDLGVYYFICNKRALESLLRLQGKLCKI